MTKRCTVARATERYSGIGLHGGKPSFIEVHPSRTPGQGIIFRSQLSGAEVTASPANVVSTNRSTCLGSGNVRVDTVEHLLSALYACGISDAVVVFDGAELPIADGSAQPFVEIIERAGIETYDLDWNELTLEQPVTVTDKYGSVLTAVPSDSFWITAVVDYAQYAGIGVQAATYAGVDYKAAISAARTYGFHHELSALKAAGLGLGASIENVVALGDDGVPDERTPLRIKDELVRHKIVDLIGDLSLVQKNIKIGIIALKPSHTLNVSLSRALLERA